MTTNKTNWEDRWLGREELLCKIMGILQKQAYITNQGSNYRGETDVALNLIDDLIQSLLDEKDKEKQEALDKQKEEIIELIEKDMKDKGAIVDISSIRVLLNK